MLIGYLVAAFLLVMALVVGNLGSTEMDELFWMTAASYLGLAGVTVAMLAGTVHFFSWLL